MNSARKYDGVDGPKVAIAHDYMTQRGGAEKVVLSMSRAFPEAPIYTMLYEPSTTYPEFADRDIRVSGLNKFRLARKFHRAALPIFPLVAESVFVDADIVLTSTSGWAHGFRTRGRKTDLLPLTGALAVSAGQVPWRRTQRAAQGGAAVDLALPEGLGSPEGSFL